MTFKDLLPRDSGPRSRLSRVTLRWAGGTVLLHVLTAGPAPRRGCAGGSGVMSCPVRPTGAPQYRQQAPPGALGLDRKGLSPGH